MKIAVVTIAANRVAHLHLQLRGLARSIVDYDHYVVAMGDGATLDAASRTAAQCVWMPAADRLPLAAARNLGAETAMAAGAELIVFLDVDCIPSPTLLDRYSLAAQHITEASLLCGPVTYLPPPPPAGYDLRTLDETADPHLARPAPPDGQIAAGTNYELFWSLSFAVTPQTWQRIGGFSIAYTGYGGEDTDFACKARAAGVTLHWVGGADAFHQYHPVSDPPIEHLDDILLNATIFHRRWGWWPMRGWLDAFAADGVIEYDASSRNWRRTAVHQPVSALADLGSSTR